MPYEVDEIKFSAVAADIRASVEIIGGKNLAAGQDNIVNVVCMAESGDKKIYKITAKRAAAHDGSVDEKPADPSVDVNDTVSTDSVGNDGDSAAKIPTVWLVTAVVASLGIGFVVGFLTKKRLAK